MNSRLSPKQAASYLPQLRDTNSQVNPQKHFLLVESNKRLTSRQKGPSIKLCSSISPVSSDSINKGCSFSNWSSNSYINNSPLQSFDSKISKANNIYSEIAKLYEEIDNLNLSPHDKEKCKSFSTINCSDEKSLDQKSLRLDISDSVMDGKGTYIYDDNKIILELKKEIEEINQKHEQLEKLYFIDTNMLKKKIESKKKKYNELKNKHESVYCNQEKNNNQNENLVKRLCENEEKHRKEIKFYIKDINELNEKLSFASLEYSNAVEYIKKIKYEKKEIDEIKKENEEKVANLIEINNGLKNQICSLMEIINKSNDELAEAKRKIEMLENEIKHMIEAKKDYLALEEKLKFTTINMEFAVANYRELQQSFSAYREKASKTEKFLRLTIEKTSPSSPIYSSSQPIERSKTKKNSYIATKFTEIQSSEASQKLLKKISSLDDELISLKQELEKNNKDLAYSKKLLDEKSMLISQLESKQNELIRQQTEKVYKSSILSFAKFLKKQKKFVENAFFLLECEICKNQTVSSIRFPCSNSYQCRKTVLTEENCIKCRGPIKKAELAAMIELVKSFMINFAEDLELAKDIEEIIR
ncbi:hypothetical protein SteCoe_15970 [Stentor coeruleus]|uniref:Uncharacterized protein n=1 Tax=Stentor coeruleus TaxID=5963 RepID=A0A1R2C2E0_9CILI|nr:hypothetical protein SteCoe_15970 [Stentor coeruleus]